jgi:hypothetical protein
MCESGLIERIRRACLTCGPAAFLVSACNPHLLQGVALAPGQMPMVGTAVNLEVSGVGGGCYVNVDWGDGVQGPSTQGIWVNLVPDPSQRTISHTYAGWGGGKTVTVTSAQGCEGKVNTRFVMAPAMLSIGFAEPGTKSCNTAGGVPDVQMGNLVHITTIPLASFPGGINFGCPLNNCIYDANGRPGSVATAPDFPFAGLREFSLVLRLGQQIVQGGTDVRFTAAETNDLEFCVNASDVTKAAGGYEIHVRVDQLGPVP